MTLDEFTAVVGVSKFSIFWMAWEHQYKQQDRKRIDYEYKKYCRTHEVPAFVNTFIRETCKRFIKNAREFEDRRQLHLPGFGHVNGKD